MAKPVDNQSVITTSAWQWSLIRKQVIARDQVCQQCGTDEQLEVDHIIERQHGGTDDLDNLQALCRTHHQAKTQATKARGGVFPATDGTPHRPCRNPSPTSRETPCGPFEGLL